MQVASLRKMVVFFAIAAVVQSSAFAGVDFAQLQLGAELSETRKKFGLPEIRIVRNEWAQRREDLYYQRTDTSLAVLIFIDGRLVRVVDQPSKGSVAEPVEHSVDQLKRLGRLAVVDLGWEEKRLSSWIVPDRILADDEAKRVIPSWSGGRSYCYMNGDILTMFRIPDDRVREIFALRVPPALADEPGLRGDATVAPTSTQAKPTSARAKRFWKGVGVVLGVAAMGYLAYETAKGIDNDSVPVILDSDPVVPYGNVTQSRIAAEFTGWDGDTLFELDNGQVWQQESYDYLYKYIYRPKVTIIRESGGYVMHVNGVSKSVKVKRLK